MGEKTSSFVKGGCGCLIAFALLGAMAALLGGSARIDLGGALCLFVFGGLLGLVVLLIYNQGKAAAAQQASPVPTEDSEHSSES